MVVSGDRGIRHMLLYQHDTFVDINLEPIVNKSHTSSADYGEYRQQYCIIIMKHSKRLELNFANH